MPISIGRSPCCRRHGPPSTRPPHACQTSCAPVRGGGREKSKTISHANGSEIHEYTTKVGVKVPPETKDDPAALQAYRDDVVDAIRDHHARGEPARSWALQFMIRRCAWHMLHHAWELEDRDLG